MLLDVHVAFVAFMPFWVTCDYGSIDLLGYTLNFSAFVFFTEALVQSASYSIDGASHS